MGQDFMEKKYRQENEAKLDALANSVSSIKQLTRNIGNQMEEEKTVIGQMDVGFVNTKDLVNNIMLSMDTMLNQPSDNICFYICLFTCMMCAFLVKFG